MLEAGNEMRTRRRVKLVVAYDGTNYCGWQVQPNGLTVAEVLNRELSRLLSEKIVVVGGSRTDAGVHSLGNVAIFDTTSRIPPEKIAFALNVTLPPDIAVQSSCEVPSDWHPLRCHSKKTYVYRILNRRMPLPTERLYSYFYHYPLDVAKMQEAASHLVGEHDFTSFASVHAQAKSAVRTIYAASVEEADGLISVRLTGNGFLYNMVRIVAGTLIHVGNGRLSPKQIPDILKRKDRNLAGPTAPAHGLTLVSWEEEGKKEDCGDLSY